MKLITLLTDFGLQDGTVGVMKGIIWGEAEDARIVDLSHAIQPQNILEGAMVLGRSAPYFPFGTVHVAVVDPGVGTERRAIAGRLGDHFFVGPDNGLVTLLLEWCERWQKPTQFVQLNRPEFWRPQVSSVFHGRDIFAPVAARLANGIALEMLGEPISAPLRLNIPRPTPLQRGWHGEVLHIDHFGNLETNLNRNHLQAFVTPLVRFGERIIEGIVPTYGAGKPGELVALLDSADQLSLSVVNGSAAALLKAEIGDAVEVINKPRVAIGGLVLSE